MSDTADLEWGTLVQVLRAFKGWSQEELAARAGVSVSSIQRQEGGLPPKPWVREKVEQALGIAGFADVLQRLLGGIRAIVNGRKELPRDLEEAGAEIARLATGALRAALAELEKVRAARAAEPVPPVIRPLGLDEVRKELLERRLRRARRMGLVPYQ